MELLLRRRPPPLSLQRQQSPQKQASDIALAGSMSRASSLLPWHSQRKKRQPDTQRTIKNMAENSNNKKKNGCFNRRGSYIDYRAELDGWMGGVWSSY
eukprot:scaffold103969_cov33-Cyclotella_meneghiniana.AAC.1